MSDRRLEMEFERLVIWKVKNLVIVEEMGRMIGVRMAGLWE